MRFTLLTDGSSDAVLLYILDWLLQRRSVKSFSRVWADLRGLRPPPASLSERIKMALELYPCELLFIHRDAERLSRESRLAEIRRALPDEIGLTPAVCVVPVRMQEAWLLFDEVALRRAAGKPHGTMRLAFPPLQNLEQEPDPKGRLYDLLRQASGLSGRHAKRFRPEAQAHRLAELIDDFTPLLQLPAFRALDKDLGVALRTLNA